MKMDKENRIKVAHRAMLISGIFCGVVALLLILNFWHMKQHEPLESEAIEALVKRLSQEPNNEVLKEEIRSFDLLARKAYFTSKWQIKAGTWLLLIGGIVLAVSMKFYTDLRAGIVPPEELTEGLLKARANAQYWLFLSGGLILGLSLVAGVLTNDYLDEYDRMAVSVDPAVEQSDVEVIEVFGGEQSTCCPNVLTPTGSDGGGDPFGFQHIFEEQYGTLLRRFKWSIRNRVKPNQVDPATNSLKNPGKLIYMSRRIIKILEKDIFKGDPALPAKVPRANLLQYLLQGIDLLDRHQFSSLLIERGVQAHSQVCITLIQKLKHGRGDPNGGYSNSPGTECKTPI